MKFSIVPAIVFLIIACLFFPFNAISAERHYSFSHSASYDDNTRFTETSDKSNTSHESTVGIDFQEVSSNVIVNIDTNFGYVNHSYIMLDDGASVNGSASVSCILLPGRWNIGLRDVASYVRDYSEIDISGSEEQVHTFSYDTEFSFKLGSKYDLSLRGVRARTENSDDAEFDEVSKNGSITLQNAFNRVSVLSFTYNYTDTVSILNGSEVETSRMENSTLGWTRAFPTSDLSLTSGLTSPVGSSSSVSDINNYSMSFRYQLNSSLIIQLSAHKAVSTIDSSFSASPTVIDSLSADEGGDVVIDWSGSGAASWNVRFFYGESIALSINRSRIVELLTLQGAGFESDTFARYHGLELTVPYALTSRLTLSSNVRLENRQFESLSIIRNLSSLDLNYSTTIGENREFSIGGSVNFQLTSDMAISATFDRRVINETSVDVMSMSIDGDPTGLSIVDTKPNANIVTVRIVYTI